jgi:hypothetical protein
MQGYMVEADGYKASQHFFLKRTVGQSPPASQHFSWSSFIKQLLLASESIYQTQLKSATEPLNAMHKFKSSIFHKLLM